MTDTILHKNASDAATALSEPVNRFAGMTPDPREVDTESFVAARTMVEREYGDAAIIAEPFFYDRFGRIWANVTRHGKQLDTVLLSANKPLTADGIYKSPSQLGVTAKIENKAWEEAVAAFDNSEKA